MLTNNAKVNKVLISIYLCNIDKQLLKISHKNNFNAWRFGVGIPKKNPGILGLRNLFLCETEVRFNTQP
jgi:hypothetical protein